MSRVKTFREIVQQTGEEIIVATLRAGSDFEREEVGEESDNQHVTQDGGLWDSMNVTPPRLETELPAEVDEISQVGVERQLLEFRRGRSTSPAGPAGSS